MSSELVVELNVSISDLQAISLSADESMVAFLLNVFPVGGDSDGTPELQLWVRHIETGRQSRIDIDTAAPVIVVEFGPQLADCALHTLTWVTTDEAGRPSTAHVATVDPSTTTTTLTCSESEILYHSADDTVHVDVQRCKGCQYLAVHARTQTKNQAFLMGSQFKNWFTASATVARRRAVHLDVGTKQCDSNGERSDVSGDDDESNTADAGWNIRYGRFSCLAITDGGSGVVPRLAISLWT
jgi:protease II